MPDLVLMCGLPGAGKTRLAREIETSTQAVRFCTDEWMADLGRDPFDKLRNKLQPRLDRLWQQLLERGLSVILEDGTWKRSERDALRRVAALSGAATELHYFDIDFDELWRRLETRNGVNSSGVAHITRETLTECWSRIERPDAAELARFDRYFVHTT